MATWQLTAIALGLATAIPVSVRASLLALGKGDVPAPAAASRGGDGSTPDRVRDARDGTAPDSEVARRVAALKGADEAARDWALERMAELGPEAAEAVPALIELLRAGVRVAATCKALGQIGPAARDATPALIAAMGDRDAGGPAAEALLKVDEGAEWKLIEALRSHDNRLVRARSAEALGAIRPAKPAATHAIAAALREDENPSVRERAASSLAQVGTVAPEVVPALIAALEDRAFRVRAAAARALGTFGKGASAAVPALRAMRAALEVKVNLRNEEEYDEEARDAALAAEDAIRRIEEGGDQGPAIPGWLPDKESLYATIGFGLALAILLLFVLASVQAPMRKRGTYGTGSGASRSRALDASEAPAVRFARMVMATGGSPELLHAFLQDNPHATPREQLEVIQVDQEYRWRAGDPRPVQEYVIAFPLIAADDALVHDLLLAEGRLAREYRAGVVPAVAEDRLPLGPSAAGDGREEGAGAMTAPPTVTHHPDDTPPGMPMSTVGVGDPQTPRRDRSGFRVEGADKAPIETGGVDWTLAKLMENRAVARPEKVGRYEVLGVLGEGTFGTVYLARDEELRRQVAVKVPKRERVASEADVETYLAEARTVATLDHPGIVPVYDVGRTADGLCYVVSKLILGRDLAQRLREGRPTPVEAVDLVAQAAEALDHAHRKGLVHRDVKPANLLLDDRATLAVADFGLALAREDFGTGARLAGTPAYMSPEQASGESHRLDARSDVFSLGVVLYELLTGANPFRGRNVYEVIERVRRHDPEPPAAVTTEVPEEISRLCVRCLAKDVRQRYQTAGELAAALRRWQRSACVSLDAQRLIPERGRPFEARDAELYLELTTSDVAEIPADVHSWIRRIGEDDPGRAFSVGLLTGPIGAGKSSLVRAGLIPRLADRATPVLVEASPASTEADLLAALRRARLDLPGDLPLPELCRWVVQSDGVGKVLIVLDQFERWLLAGAGSRRDSPLLPALRRCDGRRLQCLLVVRDEFAPVALRLLDNLGVVATPGENVGGVELPGPERASRALVRIGRALRRLPEEPVPLGHEQRLLISQVVHDLAEGEKVVPLRLAQLVQAMRDVAWTSAAFSQLGGVGGVTGGMVALLEERLGREAPDPRLRRHAGAARTVLARLLPREGHRVGAARPLGELTEAAGLDPSDPVVAGAITILVDELRLITPVPGRTTGPRYRIVDDRAAEAIRLWLKRESLGIRSRGRSLRDDG